MNAPRRDRVLAWIAVPVVAVTVYLGAGQLFGRGESGEPEHLISDDAAAVQVGKLVAAAWSGNASPAAPDHPRLSGDNYGVYVEARARGALRGSVWETEEKTLAGAIGAAVRSLRAQAESRAAEIDVVLVCTTYSWNGIEFKADDTVRGNVHRGVRGIEYRHGETTRRYSPFEMLARNIDYQGALDQTLAAEKLTKNDTASLDARVFSCEQIYAPLADPTRSRLLLRGNVEVKPEEVNAESVQRTAQLMGDWMLRSLQSDGRMTYKWWPSRGSESPGNNQIRQWMASLALARIARLRNDPAVTEAAVRNVRYNLAHYYREENGLGLIVEGEKPAEEKIKLGAIALAALAIMENPARAEFAAQEKALIATTLHLQQGDGAFETMYAPPSPDRPFQNFYTGETLLMWASLYRETRDPALLERYMKSFRYYREWHRKQRNPAFIPWHTQAHFIVYQLTHQVELSQFIMEMNDWLLGMQEWSSSRYADVRGRFYDENRKQFGPPHASSTGVYLEGLADALALARELKDGERTRAYQTAIVRGLRSVQQLQFGDDIDMFYVTNRDRVLGGMRTEVYDNSIRVDNVQHNLLALLKLDGLFAPGPGSGDIR